jgi:NTE family protein
MPRSRARLVLASLLVASNFLRAQEPEPSVDVTTSPPLLGSVVFHGGPPETRPRLVLVLSGGGARGAAHIGVLEVLDELHVVPDLVVGTSMGSIVGGLYAAGWSPARIAEFLDTLDWNQVFTDQVPRDRRSFRRKQDDTLYFVPISLRFAGIRPYIPLGLLGGQRLDLLLKSLEFETPTAQDFDDLAVPYRAVAADIGTGQAVVIGSGSLATAMRASMSISGAFAPVELDGHKLVDGGAVANLAVGIAQKIGAERIIAVDISSPLTEADSIGSFLSILNQMSGLLTVGNVQTDILRLAPEDVYLRPELGDISFVSFDRAKEAVGIGEAAAREKIDALRRFAAPDEVWRAFLERRSRAALSARTVDEIRLNNESWVADEVILRRLEIEKGKPLGKAGVTDAVMDLRALEYFGNIRCDFRDENGRGVLELDVPRAPYGRNAIQFGLGLHTDWETGRKSDSGFAFLARHQLLAVNRRGGEWETILAAGTDTRLLSHFYQPIDHGMRVFADVTLEASYLNPQIWVDEDPVARYSVRSKGGRAELGYVFEHCCEIRAGPYSFDDEAEVNIGFPSLPSFDGREAGVRGTFRMDTRDATAFPRKGTIVLAQYSQSSSDLGSDTEVRQGFVAAGHHVTFGRNTMSFAAEALTNAEPADFYQQLYTLGGVFRLSGLGDKELLGDRGGLARAMYLRELHRLSLGPIAFRVFAGASVEVGQVYAIGDPVTVESLRTGGSIYLAAETPLGPAYLGGGFTENGRQRLFFALGHTF